MLEETRSFRPKKSEKPWPALLPGVVASSETTTPLLADAALIDRAPLEKLAVAAPPSWLFRVDRKVEGVKLTAAPPLAVMVPAEKSMATLDCSTPALFTTPTVVLPVKLETSVARSMPVLRPVRLEGAGTLE